MNVISLQRNIGNITYKSHMRIIFLCHQYESLINNSSIKFNVLFDDSLYKLLQKNIK